MALAVVVGCIIEKDGKILLIQEGPEHPIISARGLWNIPAGHVEIGTPLLDNAIREAKEETGYDVGLDGIVGIYENLHSPRGDHVIKVIFKAHIVGGKSNVDGKEIGDARWFTSGEILAMPAQKLRGIRETMEDYVKGQFLPLSYVKKYE